MKGQSPGRASGRQSSFGLFFPLPAITRDPLTKPRASSLPPEHRESRGPREADRYYQGLVPRAKQPLGVPIACSNVGISAKATGVGMMKPKDSHCSPSRLISNWRMSNNIEEYIRDNLNYGEKQYLKEHLIPRNGIHRCSKHHLICTQNLKSVGSQHMTSDYQTHGNSPHQKVQPTVELYLQRYRSEPTFLNLSEEQRKRRERELLASLVQVHPFPYSL